MHSGNQAVLGMLDIDNLGILAINCERIGRQVALVENTESKRNCQCEIAIRRCQIWKLWKQKAGCRSAKANTMQTIQLSHILLLIKQSWVTIAMKTTSFQRQ